MSQVFFHELELPQPDYNLGVGSGSHGNQTGDMLKRIEEVLVKEGPESVLVYGDTNSTLAGALAAVKLHIPVAHVEAGLRSFNRQMPEEINRIVTDHISTLLFCPTETAVNNLSKEGITTGVHLVGDVMYDALCYNIRLAEMKSRILERLELRPKEYLLATVHRAENTDQPSNLHDIVSAFAALARSGKTVVFPAHPRTQKQLKTVDLNITNLVVIDPISYLDMLVLEKQAEIILTDSGGVQKEAYWFQVPCVTLRNETEWIETVESGWNRLAGNNTQRIIRAVADSSHRMQNLQQDYYGKGEAAKKISHLLMQ
jgi:UDP-N-acetylglucosamine 2-epimerase